MQAAAGRQAPGPCPDAELLGLYAERELGNDEQSTVEAHVAGCVRCQDTVAAFVRSAPGVVGAEVTAGSEPTAAWWRSGWRWLVPVTATAAVATLALWVYRPPAPPEPATVQEEALARPSESSANLSAPTAPPNAGQPAPPAALESAFRADAPKGSASRDEFAAGARQAVAPPAELAKSAKQVESERRDALVSGTLADARERLAATAPAPSPAAPPPPAAPTQVAVPDLREAIAARAPAAAPVTPRSPTAARAEADVNTKPTEMARAGAAEAAANEAGRGLATSGLAGAAAFQRPADLSGRVTYRTREALPAGAVLDVRLLDVSRTDAPAVLLGRTGIVTRGEQVPLAFALRYDAAVITPRGRYALQATITVAGRVAYRTTTVQPVLTSGAPTAGIEVVVEPMR
jgi:uncharacterized lipoprotein YbaY